MSLINDLMQVNDYIDDMYKYGYNHTFDDISLGRARKNYERILRNLANVTLPNPSSLKYSNLTLRELKEYLLSILNTILGPSFREEITKYNGMLSLEGISNPFDATIETTYQNGMWVPLKFHVSNRVSPIEVVSIAHEYIHALLSKYTVTGYNDVLSNIHYNEFLSILVEYITCYILSTILPKEELEYKHRINRIVGDHLMTLEHFEARKLGASLNSLPSSRPDIALYKKYVEYDSHKTYGYIISDIYVNKLLEHFFDDEKTLLEFIRSIINGEKSIEELIKYYNLSIAEQSTIEPYTALVDKLSLK